MGTLDRCGVNQVQSLRQKEGKTYFEYIGDRREHAAAEASGIL